MLRACIGVAAVAAVAACDMVFAPHHLLQCPVSVSHGRHTSLPSASGHAVSLRERYILILEYRCLFHSSDQLTLINSPSSQHHHLPTSPLPNVTTSPLTHPTPPQFTLTSLLSADHSHWVPIHSLPPSSHPYTLHTPLITTTHTPLITTHTPHTALLILTVRKENCLQGVSLLCM